jgi:hypothetical protein
MNLCYMYCLFTASTYEYTLDATHAFFLWRLPTKGTKKLVPDILIVVLIQY